MQYIITFLEGVISFISPCMLPMLPIYLTYFAGGNDKQKSVMPRAICFVLGFTFVYSMLGLFAGTIGAFLTKYQTVVNIVGGIIIVLFGLSYLDIIRIPFFKGIEKNTQVTGCFSAFLFGVIYSVSHTPCVGAFLGSALMMASASGTAFRGLFLLLVYSMGLGIPFLLSAILIGQLSGAFRFIKEHYRIINICCGIFLILVGIMMAMGWMQRILTFFA